MQNVADPNDPTCEEDIDMANLIQECSEPVWEGCNQSRMQSRVVLVTLCQLYSVLNTFIIALLTYLAGDVLPSSNCLPRTAYEVKSMIRKLGLQHEKIHCCPGGHVLYEAGTPSADLDKCPTCDHPRYVRGSSNVPVSVLRYFPVILQRMFKCLEVARLMEHHQNAAFESSIMKSVVDSIQ
jgi:hypothetical protein